MAMESNTLELEESHVGHDGQLERFDPRTAYRDGDPHRVYHRYRTLDPVHWGVSEKPGYPGCWYLFRHADIVALLKDRRFGKERARAVPADRIPEPPPGSERFLSMAAQWMPYRDPPGHTRLRSLMAQAFTLRAVNELAPKVEDLAKDLLDQVEGKGRMDIVSDYAFPLPITVITDMLGVPREDHAQFRRWSRALLAGVDVQPTAEVRAKASKATEEAWSYILEIVKRRRTDLQDDLISRLITAEEEGDKLSEDELIGSCLMLIWAGHETTTKFIGSSVFALLSHPDQLELLKNDPNLIESAVEELLRYYSSVHLTNRIAFTDVGIGGKTIRKGESVVAVLASGNRDPEVYPDPDRLDVTRGTRSELAFGGSIHYCLGAPLARLESKIAIRTLLARLPDLKLVNEDPRWESSIVFRGLRELPVTF